MPLSSLWLISISMISLLLSDNSILIAFPSISFHLHNTFQSLTNLRIHFFPMFVSKRHAASFPLHSLIIPLSLPLSFEGDLSALEFHEHIKFIIQSHHHLSQISFKRGDFRFSVGYFETRNFLKVDFKMMRLSHSRTYDISISRVKFQN